MITDYMYTYFIIVIATFALYQLLFFYLIRPYYLRKIFDSETAEVKVPDAAFEVVYLLILVLGIAVAPLIEISPYLLWGVLLLAYAMAAKKSRSFFLASALLFKPYRNLNLEKQIKLQQNIIVAICIMSGVAFISLGYYFGTALI